MAFSREGFYRARSGRRFLGVRGEILGKIENRESEVMNAKGVTNHVEERDALQLMDNEILHAGRPDPLVVCESCHLGRPKGWFHQAEEPAHGLLLKENSFACQGKNCSAVMCKAHTSWVNGKPMCRRCMERCDLGAILDGFRWLFTVIFFRREEE